MQEEDLDHIWIPFLSDEENYAHDPLAKKPVFQEIKTLQDVIEEGGELYSHIVKIINDEFKTSFKNYIHNAKNKDLDTLTKSILHIVTRNKYLAIIDNKLQYKNREYTHLDKNIRLTQLGEYINQHCYDDIKKLVQQNLRTKPKLISSPEEVNKYLDTIGSTTQLDKQFDVDVDNRDACFIIINNELMISQYNEKHYELINQYIKKKAIEHDSYVDAGRYRDLNEIKKYHDINIPANTPIAWGHLAYGVAYIEKLQNITLSKVVNILLSNRRFNKIYSYDYANQKITRLAKKI